MKRLACVFVGVLLAGNAFAAGEGAELYAKNCKGCHGDDGSKVAMGIPKAVKGTPAAEVSKALAGYKAGTFGGEKKAVMERVAKGLSDEQIKALADHIAGL